METGIRSSVSFFPSQECWEMELSLAISVPTGKKIRVDPPLVIPGGAL